jgi:hypothetical protein
MNTKKSIIETKLVISFLPENKNYKACGRKQVNT